MRRAGFTLIELLAAIMILAMMTIVAGITFSAVISGWHRATKLADRMQTADYALNQVVAGLRSAYYPTVGSQKEEWGFALLDNGEGENPGESDVIEWTKLGSSIIGSKSVLSETSHRIRLWVEEPQSKDEPGGLWVRAWNPDLYSEEGNDNFDEDEYGEKFLLVEDVVGFDCVVQKDSKEVESDGQPKWAETWDTSNSIPWRVKITFRMRPPEKGDEPLPILRVVEIPVAALSQNPFSLEDNEQNAAKEGRRNGRKTGGAKGGGNGGANGGGNGGANGGGQRGGQGPAGGRAPGGGMPGVGGGPAGGGGR